MTTPLTASDIKATTKASIQQGMAAKGPTQNPEPVTSLIGRPNVGPDKRLGLLHDQVTHSVTRPERPVWS